jgi:hypothetical protein
MGEIASSPRYARRTEGAQMARQLNEQGDDGLSTLLQAIDVRSAVYCVSELSAPWGFRVDGSSVPKFHLVLEGACILTLNADESLALECGDQHDVTTAARQQHQAIDPARRCAISTAFLPTSVPMWTDRSSMAATARRTRSRRSTNRSPEQA